VTLAKSCHASNMMQDLVSWYRSNSYCDHKSCGTFVPWNFRPCGTFVRREQTFQELSIHGTFIPVELSLLKNAYIPKTFSLNVKKRSKTMTTKCHYTCN